MAQAVNRIYGVVSDSLNGLLANAIRQHGKIEWVHVKYKEAAAFVAGVEAHLPGEPAVCASISSPGKLHLTSALFGCHRRCLGARHISHRPRSAVAVSRRAAMTDRPSSVRWWTGKNWPCRPGIAEMAKGFPDFMAEAVLIGRASENRCPGSDQSVTLSR
jgi:hypothetical protein